MKAINIQWDIDLEEDETYEEAIEEIGLPTEIEIPEGMEDDDEISDYLSDETGFCHKGFDFVENEEEKILKLENESEKKSIFELAKNIDNSLECFNDVYDEIKLNLHSFMCEGNEMNVFACISKARDENNEWFAIYSGVEFEGGDDVYANYDHSTESLDVNELANKLQELTDYYKADKHVKELMESQGYITLTGKKSEEIRLDEKLDEMTAKTEKKENRNDKTRDIDRE